MNTGLQSTRSIKAVIAVFSLQPDVAEIFSHLQSDQVPGTRII